MTHPDLVEAKKALERLSVEPAAQQIAREREEARWNYEHTLYSTRELGREEGKAEGRAEGRTEAKADMLLRLLTLKFGSLEGDLRGRLLRAPEPELDRWLFRILEAQTLEDVFGQ